MNDRFPPPLSPEEAATLRRRRRGRNIALLVVLVAFCILFYAITMVKMSHGGTPPATTGWLWGLEHAREMAMMRHPVPVGSA